MSVTVICQSCNEPNSIVSDHHTRCRKCSEPFPDAVMTSVLISLRGQRPFLVQLGKYLSLAYASLLTFGLLMNLLDCGNYFIDGKKVHAHEFTVIPLGFFPSALIAFFIWDGIRKNETAVPSLCILFWPLYFFGMAMTEFQRSHNWLTVMLTTVIGSAIPLFGTVAYFKYKKNVVDYYTFLRTKSRPHVT